MNLDPQSRLLSLLEQRSARFDKFDHPPCRSSEESAAARARAGAGETTGAKALLVKTRKDKAFVVCVLPGTRRVDAKKLQAVIGRYRFARKEEMEEIAGLTPGSFPPFGGQLFPNVDRLVVDPSLSSEKALGFNMACPTSSIVMSGREYFRILESDEVEFAEISSLTA